MKIKINEANIADIIQYIDKNELESVTIEPADNINKEKVVELLKLFSQKQRYKNLICGL